MARRNEIDDILLNYQHISRVRVSDSLSKNEYMFCLFPY